MRAVVPFIRSFRQVHKVNAGCEFHIRHSERQQSLILLIITVYKVKITKDQIEFYQITRKVNIVNKIDIWPLERPSHIYDSLLRIILK